MHPGADVGHQGAKGPDAEVAEAEEGKSVGHPRKNSEAREETVANFRPRSRTSDDVRCVLQIERREVDTQIIMKALVTSGDQTTIKSSRQQLALPF